MHGDFDGFLFDIAEFFEDCARRFEQVIAFHIFEHEPFAAELRELFVNCIGFGAKRSIVFDGNGLWNGNNIGANGSNNKVEITGSTTWSLTGKLV